MVKSVETNWIKKHLLTGLIRVLHSANERRQKRDFTVQVFSFLYISNSEPAGLNHLTFYIAMVVGGK